MNMANGFSRRGFLKGLLASVSIAALPLPEIVSGAIQTSEPLAVPFNPPPFRIILDEVGYYMPDDIDLFADAFQFELCAPLDGETELSEPAEIGRACVAALKDRLAGRGVQQEALRVRRFPHMATVV